MIDFFSSSYNDFIVMGDYISQPTDNLMKDFMEANGSINLIKCNKQEIFFKHSDPAETGISYHHHHHLICAMPTPTISKAEAKLVNY